MSAANTDFLQVARILKSNGTEGEVILGFKDFYPEDINLKEPVFIKFDGLLVPFFINSFTVKGTRAFARLTGVKNLEDAEEIVGKEVYAKADTIEEYEEDGELTFDDLIGWTVLSPDGSKVGNISDYEDIPGNPCLYITTVDGQVMVPFHEDLVVSLDDTTKEMTLRIPEGLL